MVNYIIIRTPDDRREILAETAANNRRSRSHGHAQKTNQLNMDRITRSICEEIQQGPEIAALAFPITAMVLAGGASSYLRLESFTLVLTTNATRLKRRVMKALNASLTVFATLIHCVSTTASLIAILLPMPRCAVVACATSLTRRALLIYQGLGSRIHLNGQPISTESDFSQLCNSTIAGAVIELSRLQNKLQTSLSVIYLLSRTLKIEGQQTIPLGREQKPIQLTGLLYQLSSLMGGPRAIY